MNDRAERNVFLVSLLATLLLLCMKVSVGLMSNSRALLYDGLESLFDLLIILLALGMVRFALKPPDSGHQFGHTKAESLGELYIGIFITAAGIYLTYETLVDLLQGHLTTPGAAAFAAAAFTVAAKEGLYRYTMLQASRTGSPVLRGLAADHRKDAATSLVTVVGTSASFTGLHFLDTLAALVTSLIIIGLGVSTLHRSSYDLLDASPEKQTLQEIKRIAESCQGVRSVSSLKVRKSGRYLYVEVTIEVDRKISIESAHDIAESLKKEIMMNNKKVRDVIVHVEPEIR